MPAQAGIQDFLRFSGFPPEFTPAKAEAGMTLEPNKHLHGAAARVLSKHGFSGGRHSKGDALLGQLENWWGCFKKVFRNGLQLVIESHQI
jgi:hypothetical protein